MGSAASFVFVERIRSTERCAVIARKTITAANGPGEVGDISGFNHEAFEAVAVFPAGTEINVYIDYQNNGYVYSNSRINPFMGSAYQFFYVKLDDVTIK